MNKKLAGGTGAVKSKIPDTAVSTENILEINGLTIHYITDDSTVKAVNDVSLSIGRGETLGLVGETGAGKTTIALGIMGLIPNPPGKVIGGEILLDGENVNEMNKKRLNQVRGVKMSMIFQDPMTSLNPVDKVGDQIAETISLHENISKAEAKKKACKMLELVGIHAGRYNDYPHQFSGGMKQRIVIAIALACNPQLLIADEPTTALDVTIQAQVLDMMNHAKSELGTSMLMITHDLGIIAEMCDRVAIIYAGEIVEIGNMVDIFDETTHPYTRGLFDSLPNMVGDSERLKPIPGLMPDPTNLPAGCKFSPRCPYATDACRESVQELENIGGEHFVRCSRWKEIKGER